MAVEYVPVAEQEGSDPIEVPTEADGSLPLATLAAQFPGACGLRYRSPDTGALRAVRLTDGVLARPGELHSWCHNGNVVYLCTFGKDNKRKNAGECEDTVSSAKRRQCTDLIVLGLPYKVTEEDLKDHFSRFGDVAMSQIKRDQQGNSKGYGFIRFAEFDSQIDCLSCPRHQIAGRWCEAKVPLSQAGDSAGQSGQNSRRVFVGRVTEELTGERLKEFFGTYGEIEQVFVPKPFRAFAFITFAESSVAQSLLNEDFVIDGVSVHVGSANPKPQPQMQQQQMLMRGNRMMQNNFGRGGSFNSMGGGGGGVGGFRNRGWQPNASSSFGGGGGGAGGSGSMYQDAVTQALAANPQVLAAALAQMAGLGGSGGGGGRQQRGGGGGGGGGGGY